MILVRLLLVLTLSLLLSTRAGAESSRLDRVLATKELRVCYWPDYYGISYRNPKSLELSGIDIDLARELGKDLGVQVRFVDSSFARLIEDITQDRCDIAMFAVGVTPARAEMLRFSSPHLVSDMYAITSRGNRRVKEWGDIDKPGVIVAVAKGTYHEEVMKRALKNATLLVTATHQGREQEVEAGRADVFMTDYPFSRRMLETTDWARLIAPSAPFHLTSYAYAMARGDERWAARVDAFVAAIKRDGRLFAAARYHKLEAIVAKD